ncbi:MAG: hypothetical protein NT118_03030 [Lentisphaerae bacterium]|nr:hypothetical protein [Lentisphaerota bacterium]
MLRVRLPGLDAEGYDIDGSLRDFIRNTYGDGAVKFIEENM